MVVKGFKFEVEAVSINFGDKMQSTDYLVKILTYFTHYGIICDSKVYEIVLLWVCFVTNITCNLEVFK